MTARGWLGIGVALVVTACSDTGTGPRGSSCAPGQGTLVALVVGGYTSVDPATGSGCVEFEANPSATDSAEYLLVPQSAASVPGQSTPFVLRGSTMAPLASAAAGSAGRPGSTAARFDAFLRDMARTRAYPTPPPNPVDRAARSAATAGPPTAGSLRNFKVCASLTCSTFKSVAARAQTVGAHVAIYVDTLAPASGLVSADLDSLAQVFDGRLYPLDTATFGGVSDIDTNGVAIVLMTGVVNGLVTRSQCHSSGYVAGFFFAGDIDPAFAAQYNHGEIFYSVVADPDSTLSCAHSRAQVKRLAPLTFTHEFQHMISYVQHVLVQGGANEEGWLDEGLSKYAEELAGRSFLPGDPATFSSYVLDDLYDASQYFSAPGSVPLLIPSDNGTLSEIGASWLFVRYLVDQFGDSLPRRLHATALTGAANVAAQTGQPFATLLGRWALANWVSDLPAFTTPAELRYQSWQFRSTFASLNAQDPADFPQPFPLVPSTSAGSTVNVSGVLRSGSGVFHRAFQAPAAPGFSLSFTINGTASLPAGVVPRLTVIRIR